MRRDHPRTTEEMRTSSDQNRKPNEENNDFMEQISAETSHTAYTNLQTNTCILFKCIHTITYATC